MGAHQQLIFHDKALSLGFLWQHIRKDRRAWYVSRPDFFLAGEPEEVVGGRFKVVEKTKCFGGKKLEEQNAQKDLNSKGGMKAWEAFLRPSPVYIGDPERRTVSDDS